MRILISLLSLVIMQSALAREVILSWQPSDEEVQFYRVYQYDPEKRLVYEGTETTYTQEQNESTMFGIAQVYSDGDESDVFPGNVCIVGNKPTVVNVTVEVQ